jgi:type VI secretion system secreted protein Hcp
MAPTAGLGAGSSSDIFLHLQAKRAGKIKGEAASTGHKDDIVVSAWRWGLSVTSAHGANSVQPRSYTALTVVKQIDAATTPLMSAVATNDEIKEAKLTMRKAGGEQEDYFIVTLKAARIASLQHEVEASGDTREVITIAFTEVEVEYRLQSASGGRGASTTFTDSLPARG